MEIAREKFIQLISKVHGDLKFLETEILAAKVVFATIQAMYPDLPINSLLETAKHSDSVRNEMDKKYSVLQESLQLLDQATLDSELSQWIREWKPTGPIQ